MACLAHPQPGDRQQADQRLVVQRPQRVLERGGCTHQSGDLLRRVEMRGDPPVAAGHQFGRRDLGGRVDGAQMPGEEAHHCQPAVPAGRIHAGARAHGPGDGELGGDAGGPHDLQRAHGVEQLDDQELQTGLVADGRGGDHQGQQPALGVHGGVPALGVLRTSAESGCTSGGSVAIPTSTSALDCSRSATTLPSRRPGKSAPPEAARGNEQHASGPQVGSTDLEQISAQPVPVPQSRRGSSTVSGRPSCRVRREVKRNLDRPARAAPSPSAGR
jgi:hypothetical protein